MSKTKPSKSGIYGRADAVALTGYSPESINRLIRIGVVKPLRTPSGQNIFTDEHIEVLKAHREASKRRRRVA